MAVLERHLICQADEDGILHGVAVVQVTDMVPEGTIVRFDEEDTGGLAEVLIGPDTYRRLQDGEDIEGGEPQWER